MQNVIQYNVFNALITIIGHFSCLREYDSLLKYSLKEDINNFGQEIQLYHLKTKWTWSKLEQSITHMKYM